MNKLVHIKFKMNQREAQEIINRIEALNEMIKCTDSFWFQRKSNEAGPDLVMQTIILNISLMTGGNPITTIQLLMRALKYYVEMGIKVLKEENEL